MRNKLVQAQQHNSTNNQQDHVPAAPAFKSFRVWGFTRVLGQLPADESAAGWTSKLEFRNKKSANPWWWNKEFGLGRRWMLFLSTGLTRIASDRQGSQRVLCSHLQCRNCSRRVKAAATISETARAAHTPIVCVCVCVFSAEKSLPDNILVSSRSKWRDWTRSMEDAISSLYGWQQRWLQWHQAQLQLKTSATIE